MASNTSKTAPAKPKPKPSGRREISAKGKRQAPSGKPERPFPRLRITVRPGLVLGPGKVALLDAIEHTGSISGAGREMGMSYRRAWLLVSALNEMFGRVVVSTSPGGAGGGGAQVTDFGRAVAEAYWRAEERSQAAVREEFAGIGHDMEED